MSADELSAKRKRDTRVGKLNAALVSKILRGPPCSPVNDGGGLYLDHPRQNAGYWFYRWSRDGRDTRQDIGPTHTFNLAEARERARKLRQMRCDGLDPKAERQKTTRPSATLASIWPSYRAAHIEGRSPKHVAQYDLFWSRYIGPALGNLDLTKIATNDVLQVVEPVWRQTASHGPRVRGLIENLIDHATARGLRLGDNPARWKGHLQHLLGERKTAVVHLEAAPWRQVPAIMERLRAVPGTVARATEITALLAARPGEIREARWSWIDWESRVLMVPAPYMKGRAEHRKPLADRAMTILSELAGHLQDSNDGLIFRRDDGKPPADYELGKCMRACGPTTLHGLRSSFADWAHQTTHFSREAIELSLAHKVKGSAERAYWRDDHLEKRRALIEEWARFCSGPAVAGEVVELRRAAI